MNNSVAGRTYRHKVAYRINLIATPDAGNRDNMMHVNKAFGNFPKSFAKVDVANLARIAVMRDAGSTR